MFDNALKTYETKTGKNLTSDPLLRRFGSCDSLDAVLVVLQEFHRSGNQTNWLTKWLNPVVKVLCTFSPTIGGAVSLVSRSQVTRPLSAPLH
jgi:hypothetical protein